jgi:hypothetical protein
VTAARRPEEFAPKAFGQDVPQCRTGMMAVFAASGFLLATWGARLPALRSAARLSPDEVGLVVSSLGAGMLVALLLAGQLVSLRRPIPSMRYGALLSAAALILVALLPVASVVMVGAFVLGFGNGLYDVAMNDWGGRLGERLLPTLHGAWSLGALTGALGALTLALLDVPLPVHLVVAALLATGLTWRGTARQPPDPDASRSLTVRCLVPKFDGWRSRHTVSLGFVALGASCAEGAANEWLTLSLTDDRGFGAPPSVAAGGLGIFIVGMVGTRLMGGAWLSRFGAVRVLTGSVLLVAGGTGLIVSAGMSGHRASIWALVVSVPGLLFWGTGAALGVPLAMQRAGSVEGVPDHRAPDRISIVATIGFAAFLPGPLLISAIGQRFGYLWSLLVAPGVMVPAFTVAGLLMWRDVRAGAARPVARPGLEVTADDLGRPAETPDRIAPAFASDANGRLG